MAGEIVIRQKTVVQWVLMDRVLHGTPASHGRAAAQVRRMTARLEVPAARPLDMSVEDAEQRLREAAAAVKSDLDERSRCASGAARDLLAVTAAMAADPAILDGALALVRAESIALDAAVWRAAESLVDQLTAIGGPTAERAADVRDVRNRLIASLQGTEIHGVPRSAVPFVLVAEDLGPVDTAGLDVATVRAIVTASGGPTSHSAILARELGIPAVVGLGWQASLLTDGDVVGVDGSDGTIRWGVTADTFDDVRGSDGLTGPVHTTDGTRVTLLANVGDAAGAEHAAASGAEGIGLLRTEIPFLGAMTEPSVAEQAEAYGRVFELFPGRTVIVRTLDAGADKPVPFLTSDVEPNPALGVRGYRTSRIAPEVLARQLEAIAEARASHSADVWVMAPMISTVPEAEEFVRLARSAGLPTAGVMIEVPSAALLASRILAVADFASIGTNDLAQYTLAADRGLRGVSDLPDAWDPSVLNLISSALTGGDLQGRSVGVCGEAAADPALAVVLTGLGARSLSMAPRALGRVARQLSAVSLAQCRRLARLATDAPDAASARSAVLAALPRDGASPTS